MGKKFVWIALLLAWMVGPGCSSSPTFVSQQSVEDKVARVRLGETTTGDIEAIFGPPQLKEKRLWAYNFADTESDFREVKGAVWAGLMPPMSTTVATNTRALITLRFDDAGKVKGLEVARYFSEPYNQEYRYLTKENPEKLLPRIATIGEQNGFKVSKAGEAPAKLKLEEPGGKAWIAVESDDQTLHITSTNPYDRVSTEYRVFVKRETAFIDQVSRSELLQ